MAALADVSLRVLDLVVVLGGAFSSNIFLPYPLGHAWTLELVSAQCV